MNENELCHDDVTQVDHYSNVTCKEALECFYKLKGFLNQNNPDGLTDLLNLEDELYIMLLIIVKKQTKIMDFYKK